MCAHVCTSVYILAVFFFAFFFHLAPGIDSSWFEILAKTDALLFFNLRSAEDLSVCQEHRVCCLLYHLGGKALHAETTGYKSWLHLLPAVKTWTRLLNTLSLIFLICKVERIKIPTSLSITWKYIYKLPSTRVFDARLLHFVVP